MNVKIRLKIGIDCSFFIDFLEDGEFFCDLLFAMTHKPTFFL
jgi:hypothetical protein